MKSSTPALFAAGLLAQHAAAHSIFQQASSGSTDFDTLCTRMPPNNSPVTSVTSGDMTCNVGGTKGVSGFCEVNAGDEFTVEMHAQPGDRSCANEAIGGNHFGPVLIYMSKVDDASTADGSGDWFKVDEFGYDASTKTWGTDKLNENCGKRTFKIPSHIPAGDYLVRAEAIALHTANQPGGAQFYMSCYQVRISGGEGGQLPAGVKIPGAYSANDPGILVDIWGNDFNEYVIPGPPVIDSSYF
ncbi:glycoside hydrolase family 61 protein [Thermothelomyces thermophilus ATCC 42464]|uniref:lytic cellulose monooxygenase (C4-dehydrogenating) n=1 Tax=Thermothelomyces thermophilus (strain ATCC 42464 / BCRC 31852 / DSM 1799) TaxID=573729 RepID=G2Q774_THET4|nr:glycoside hydrolase family 61 protein [Thermothelomyces thermophilus ATCC 42464]AEO55652.1 glycoside hydrolase family 61 protein [Thermothelomyces thermophilus ATCC 42464]